MHFLIYVDYRFPSVLQYVAGSTTLSTRGCVMQIWILFKGDRKRHSVRAASRWVVVLVRPLPGYSVTGWRLLTVPTAPSRYLLHTVTILEPGWRSQCMDQARGWKIRVSNPPIPGAERLKGQELRPIACGFESHRGVDNCVVCCK